MLSISMHRRGWYNLKFKHECVLLSNIILNKNDTSYKFESTNKYDISEKWGFESIVTWQNSQI
jgi:hypothetical protein